MFQGFLGLTKATGHGRDVTAIPLRNKNEISHKPARCNSRNIAK
jgi:hypothetical protein